MILTAHQPVYLPWLGLFHKIAISDTYVYFDNVQYLPKDWMNRNKIKTNNDEIWLTVPVLRKGYRDLRTSEIKINNSTDWQKKHLRSISLNYKKTEYFDDYFPFFEEVYTKTWNTLSNLNEYMLRWFLKQLGIKLENVYYTQGHYDFVDIIDAPGPEAVLAFSIWYSNKGFGRIQTLPAFGDKAIRKVISKNK